MDPQSSTGQNTDLDFEDAEFVNDHVQLAGDLRVTIEEVRNPNSVNANVVNECSNSKLLIQMFKYSLLVVFYNRCNDYV
ncbi:hypothetical protein Hanom_Chr11g01055491 [Helianthus anomalus]